MKIITCCSYYGTGSSAVTDYFSEFNNVESLGDYEFRFLHDPDGVRDLEYNLVENFNRHNSGHALKRFKRLVDYYGNHFLTKRYEPFFNNQWKIISYKYIDRLTDFRYKGSWQYDYYDRGSFFEFWHKLPGRFLKKTIWRKSPDKSYSSLKNEITYCSNPTKEQFLRITKEYLAELFEVASKQGKEYLMIDQLFPSSNINHFLDYIEDVFVFVVDRDPRDVYISYKYLYPNSIVPSNVEDFCKWYRYCRSSRKTENWNSNHVLFVQFEDLIYKYKETTTAICSFLGVREANHVRPFTFFNPEKSKNNTRLWTKYSKYKQEIDIIEKSLSEYLYYYGGEQ